jgi:hypothetical protein
MEKNVIEFVLGFIALIMYVRRVLLLGSRYRSGMQWSRNIVGIFSRNYNLRVFVGVCRFWRYSGLI